MHIVSHGYYSGKLSKGGKATVFKGNMESMIKLYSTGNAPRIANTKEKAKLKIRIRATKKINFEEPVFFYAYAADYP